MILKASEFRFPGNVRLKYFPLVIRALPPEGWPEGAVVVTDGKSPYKRFLQTIGAPSNAQFQAEMGEWREGDPRALLSIIEEIALNCPLKQDEVITIKRDYEIASLAAGDHTPSLFVQGLIPSIWLGFESGLLSFQTALILSLYAPHDAQREIVGLGVAEERPEVLLRLLEDPFFAGDFFNYLKRDPGKLRVLGYESLPALLKKGSPLSYGRTRLLMRLAAAIPPERRRGLTGDQGEFLLRAGRELRERLFRGETISIDGATIVLSDLQAMSRSQARELIKKLKRREQHGDNA